MGVEDRDWYRDTGREKRRPAAEVPVGALLVVAILGGLVMAGALRWKTSGPDATYGGTSKSHLGAVSVSILPGLPRLTIGGDSLYPKNDRWRSYLADEETCPGGENLDAPLAQQAETMVCLVNYAREQRGLEPVVTVAHLNQASIAKAEKITRCRDFNHDACGTDPPEDARALGYNGAWGENLFIAGGPWGAPRPALDGWLNSPGHRDNLFRPEWTTQGIAVQKLTRFGRDRNMTLWVNQFGTG